MASPRELAALPDEKLGVVVVASHDVANAVTHRIAKIALRLMLAAKEGKPLPKHRGDDAARSRRAALASWRGATRTANERFDLLERDGQLCALSRPRRLPLSSCARLGDDLIVDDQLDYGTEASSAKDGKLRIGKNDLRARRGAASRGRRPSKWRGLIGEYGWDHNTLLILEKDGKLHALIEWFFLYPLTEESENVFKFPDYGLYHGEKLIFTRDKQRPGHAGRGGQRRLRAAQDRRRERRDLPASSRVRPVEELRTLALAAKPPAREGRVPQAGPGRADPPR